MNALAPVPLSKAEQQETASRYHVSDPLPLYPIIQPSKPYPIEALGPVLGSAASAIASKIQVPNAIAGQSVLTVASLASQALADVELPYGQKRPLSLNAVSILETGGRKTSADEEAAWPVRKHERNLRERHDADYPEWKIKASAHAAQKRKIENDSKLTLSQREFELRALGNEPLAPLHPILTAPDPTIEGLAKAWPLAPASLGVFSAEGGQFVGGHGMSAEHKLKTAAALSELWDGRGMRRLRAGDGLTILNGRRFASHLMIQVDAATSFMSDPILKDQGFLSRILVAAPDSIFGTRLYREPRPEDDAAIRAYGARILSLLESSWPFVEGKRNELDPRGLMFTPDAKAFWRDYFDYIETQSGPGGELDGVRDFAAKSAEQAARVAGVLTIVADPHAVAIELREMECGAKLADWHLQEAARLTTGARVDPRLARAGKMLGWLKKQSPDFIHLRQILQFGPKPLRTKALAVDALSVLAEHGHVTHDPDRNAYRLRNAA